MITIVEMAQIWSEILDMEFIEADDQFFDIGGNSLLAIEVIVVVNARTGIALPLSDFFADPTPRGTAAAVALRGAGPVPEGKVEG